MFMFMSCHVRHLTDLLASYPPLLTRQEAVRFNQPLDWDTSRVTIMGEMFRVHSARALRSDSSLEPSLPLHAACTAAAPRRPPRIICPPFGSVGSEGVQPAAELGNVQRHKF